MRRRYRVTRRPSKASGIMGAVFGGIFVLIGLFVVIPTFGLFGILWTAMAAAITGFNLFAAFGKNRSGDNSYNEYMGSQIDIESGAEAGYHDISADSAGTVTDAEARLQQLQRLLDAGLITREEYEEKREEIIRGL